MRVEELIGVLCVLTVMLAIGETISAYRFMKSHNSMEYLVSHVVRSVFIALLPFAFAVVIRYLLA